MRNSVVDAGVRTELIPGGGDVLLLSMRKLAKLVAYCPHYEFEDVTAEVTDADRIDVGEQAPMEFARRVYRYSRLTTGSRAIARALSQPPSIRLTRRYDLFLPVFNNAYELFALAAVENWRSACRYAACFVSEVWSSSLPRYLLELLSEFDHVFIGAQHPIDDVAAIVKRPCSYLPLAADVLRFSPFPNPPARVIDVCNIGRRSSALHEALLKAAWERERFYYYDTSIGSGPDARDRTFRVGDHREHRLLLANIVQRSRYFIVNRSKIDDTTLTTGKDETAPRFFEGAAAGAVMVGDAPRTEIHKGMFDWPDAVTHLPFDSADWAAAIEPLERDPARVSAIRRNNVGNAALRHDWVHRLRTVFESVRLAPTEKMLAREARLRALARDVHASG